MSLDLREDIADRYGLGYDIESENPLHGVQSGVEALQHPEESFESVHVTASKGAGSTAAFLRLALQEAGYTVGLFSGAGTTDLGVREKYSINGTHISEADIWHYADIVNDHVDTRDEWDFLVLMALCYFADHDVDVAVFEAGIGGETDSTNILSAHLCVIPNAVVTPNHPELGDTDVEVAEHKAGIIHEHSVAVANGTPDVNARIHSVAANRGASFSPARSPITFTRAETGLFHGDYNGHTIESTLLASYLCDNINTAVTGLEDSSFTVSHEAICRAVEQFRFPGRCEYRTGNPAILLDGASNAFSARALREELTHLDDVDTLVFSGPPDCWAETLPVLEPLADTLIFPDCTDSGLIDTTTLHDAYPNGITTSSAGEALHEARLRTPESSVILITGSLKLVRDARIALGSTSG